MKSSEALRIPALLAARRPRQVVEQATVDGSQLLVIVGNEVDTVVRYNRNGGADMPQLSSYPEVAESAAFADERLAKQRASGRKNTTGEGIQWPRNWKLSAAKAAGKIWYVGPRSGDPQQPPTVIKLAPCVQSEQVGSKAGFSAHAQTLLTYIESLPDFVIVTSIGDRYEHMGATLTDAVLQAGINYENVVRPRAIRLRDGYPEAKTTSGFARLIERSGLSEILNWREGSKPERLRQLVKVLLHHRIETEDHLRIWLEDPANLNRLRQIKGIKDKTVHYLQILIGAQTVAVDIHLFRLLTQAGLSTNNYEAAHQLILETAALLGIGPPILDHSIWRYMSERS
jgi:hypothetical protein